MTLQGLLRRVWRQAERVRSDLEQWLWNKRTPLPNLESQGPPGVGSLNEEGIQLELVISWDRSWGPGPSWCLQKTDSPCDQRLGDIAWLHGTEGLACYCTKRDTESKGFQEVPGEGLRLVALWIKALCGILASHLGVTVGVVAPPLPIHFLLTYAQQAVHDDPSL